MAPVEAAAAAAAVSEIEPKTKDRAFSCSRET